VKNPQRSIRQNTRRFCPGIDLRQLFDRLSTFNRQALGGSSGQIDKGDGADTDFNVRVIGPHQFAKFSKGHIGDHDAVKPHSALPYFSTHSRINFR